MPKRAKELTAAAVAKLREPGRYAVGGAEGLHLRITPAGTKLWVCRIMVGEKRVDLGLGDYRDVSLSDARDKARDARRSVRLGVSPVQPKPKLEAPVAPKLNTFKMAALELIASKKNEWKNAKHKAQWESTLETYAFPVLGGMDVSAIGLPEILSVLKPIWLEKTETATRVRGRIESVLDYATVHNWRAGDNPARWRGLLDKVLPAPGKIAQTEHHKAMPSEETPAFMRLMEGAKGTSPAALRLLVLTAARSGEIRGARWDEFDLVGGVWTIPAERMKAGAEHRVPLSKQALRLLSELPRFDGVELLFPSALDGKKPISDMTMTNLLRKRGMEYVPHGFRSTFRDWAGDNTEYPRELIEAALAHTIENKTEAAYRRKSALERRRPLMQDWADYLDGANPHAAKPQSQTVATR
jgi:integrase